ncbi:glucose-1-phosphate adenylyltransferase [Paenibacillus sp. BIHB 4019]|uniref:Glucose-1-phosphate adenylyltransferase n=1 Tax=Paenibacillus sp. BIHB 4019 TaxID=1870819 RepID=A0A1B2DI03_9BACL|nr:glucose-1-phosphate adenylyltransferase [Paenibacillus sp. BIHB 4019]ANY67352.1 glucose-1-phosphate adenylyltransferase [Paenibacillus sp. BIHB 4019]
MPNNTDCIAMLLAGGQGSRLAPFTGQMAKPVVSFGDRFRMIDFPLSNCINSGIRTIGVLTQYCSDSVHDHITDGEAWLRSATTKHSGEITMLPASRVSSSGCYTGTADALLRNIAYVDEHHPEHVLVLSGDHIYQMDYRPMLEFHKANQAMATIAVKQVPWREAHRFGIMHTDEQSRIMKFEEKPANPESNLASMGIYLFRWQDLRRFLLEDAANPLSSHDFGKDIIPAILAAEENLNAYPYEGYWRDVGTVESLWEAHMELLDGEMSLSTETWPLRSKEVQQVRKPYVSPQAVLSNSIAHPGCTIEGRISRSVLGAGVSIGKGSGIAESIIMPGAKIGRNVIIHRAIIGENAVIHDGAIIGERTHGDIAVVAPGEAIVAHFMNGSSKLKALEQLEQFEKSATELVVTGEERFSNSVLHY